MIVQITLMTIGAYFLGAIPTSYIASRLLKGIDIRSYGSGVSSGSNVWHSVSRWAGVTVVTFDILKGLVPVTISYYVLGFDIWAAGIVGLAAIAGHSWSIFLRFHGGRGVATMMGSLMTLVPLVVLVFVVIMLLGFIIFKNSPISMLFGVAATPLASLGLGNSPGLTLCLFGMVLLLITKRLLAERTIPPGEWKRVMIYRLFLDRDTRNREAWIYQAFSSTEET
ncbi:MAG: glycerol-3-phosphate acyltransferase [Dehalococcoidia bacterium]|nr:glycerol-3-phosphate acyltransferase [Dehalococcoidia bacterium]